MTPDSISDENLLYLVGTTDKKLFDAGRDVKQRYWEVPRAVLKELGITVYTGRPIILERVENAFRSMYRQQDIAMGGHVGVFLYRDIFARIGVPHVYGAPVLKPFDFVDLTPVQKRIIQTEPDQIETFLDQFYDCMDVQYGTEQIKQPFAANELVVRFFGLARLHLHAAAAVLTGGYDFRGAVQSSLLATELALKGGAAAQGLTEKQIKDQFGHKNNEVANFLGANLPNFDLQRVQRVIDTQPPYVPSRYDANQPDRGKVGHLVMGAQFIVSEAVRQVSDRNSRAGAQPLASRRYPA